MNLDFQRSYKKLAKVACAAYAYNASPGMLKTRTTLGLADQPVQQKQQTPGLMKVPVSRSKVEGDRG